MFFLIILKKKRISEPNSVRCNDQKILSVRTDNIPVHVRMEEISSYRRTVLIDNGIYWVKVNGGEEKNDNISGNIVLWFGTWSGCGLAFVRASGNPPWQSSLLIIYSCLRGAAPEQAPGEGVLASHHTHTQYRLYRRRNSQLMRCRLTTSEGGGH